MSRSSVFGLCLVIVSLAVVIPVSAADQWIDVGSATAGTPPSVDVRKVVGGIDVEVDLAGFFVEERMLARGAFTVLEVPQFGRQGAIGEPEIPFRTVLIPIANGPAASLTVLDSDSSIVMSGITVMPRQAPELDCSTGPSEFVMDDKAYASDRLYPAEPARISDEVVVRGQRFLIVEVSPLAFNPVRQEVSVRPSLRINIDLAGGEDAAAENLKIARHSALFPTKTDLDTSAVPDAVPTGVEYLIIADDTLATAFEPLAEWKRMKGMTVEIVLMSTIGTTSAQLKAYLQNRYDTDPDLTYVLLGGDHPAVPSESVGGKVTDLYYSCLDGTDYFPDLVMGRIAVGTLADCQNVISKILAWDRDPVPGVWHGDFLMAALLQDYDNYDCEADRWFFETGTHAMHYVRDVIGMGIHTAATSDSLSCSPYDWRSDSYPHRFSGYAGQSVPTVDADFMTSASQSTTDITDAINGGVSLVQHRDHGGVTLWGDPPFNISNINALANGDMTPIVYSINCLTGTFDHSSDCFAEAFMKKYPGGAVGIIAATESSYSGYNDLIVHGSYDCFWDDYDPADGGNIYPHSFRPAEAYNYGKYYMYNWEGASATYTQLEFELFHWHGDPEMMAYTATPTSPTVTTDSAIPVGSTTLTVTTAADGALVAVTDDGVLIGRGFVTGGVAVVDLTPAPGEPTTLDVVVTGHNLVPWQGTVEVIVPVGPWMAFRSYIIDDSTGNGDGIANPGESIILPVTVENIGTDDGTGISGVLSSGSADVTVTDAAASFPDATAGAQVQSLPDHYSAVVDPATANGHVANLNLDWAAAGGFTGTSVFSLPVCAPLLISDVSVDFIGNDTATVNWTTNVPATSQLTWGTTTPVNVIDGIVSTTDHVVDISGLDPCTGYVFEVSSSSADCYTAVDDNVGALYRLFTTAGAPVNFDATDTPVSIPDSDMAGASSTITVVSDHAVVDVDLLVNITHTYTGDLELFLIAPDGTSVMLSDQHGGSGNNYTDTVFDDAAAASISGGSPPFTGSFQPDQPLATLDGQSAAGVWTFKVVDRLGGDLGSIDDWQLRLKVNEPCDSLFADDFESGNAGAWSSASP